MLILFFIGFVLGVIVTVQLEKEIGYNGIKRLHREERKRFEKDWVFVGDKRLEKRRSKNKL